MNQFYKCTDEIHDIPVYLRYLPTPTTYTQSCGLQNKNTDNPRHPTQKLVRSDSFGPGCREKLCLFLPPSTRRPFLRLTVALGGRGPVWLHPPSLPLSPSFALSTDPEWISTRSSLMSLCRSTLAKNVQHGSPGDKKRGEMCLSILSSILHCISVLFFYFFSVGR